MIIVSQDKDWIFNFDNATSIGIDEENILKIINTAGKWNILGKYKTRERAKEVLQEIVQKYSSYLKLEGGPAILQGQMDIQPNIFNIPKAYVMPEE